MYRIDQWQPTASLSHLQTRAKVLKSIRHFFDDMGVMEVDTQVLSLASISDPHIEVLTTQAKCQSSTQTYYMQTSPEFAMKRLLCAGVGDIYQLGKVFRAEEESKRHSIEFTMLEWYRVGMNHWQLMSEIEELLVRVTNNGQLRCQYKSYQQAFITYLAIDPFTASLEELQKLAQAKTEYGAKEEDRDTLLELLFSTQIEPKLGADQPCFIHSYPTSQAALARTYQAEGGNQVSCRFELYWQGMELANGYHELTDPEEQQRRFQQDKTTRAALSLAERQFDERLITAMQQGLPECAGVALGVDRLLMLLLKADSIEKVLPFASDRV